MSAVGNRIKKLRSRMGDVSPHALVRYAPVALGLGITPMAEAIPAVNSSEIMSPTAISMMDQHPNVYSNLGNNAPTSLWDMSACRETHNHPNPAGAIAHGYYGRNQVSFMHAQNIIIYGLLHEPYKKIARSFMQPGYEKSLQKFEQQFAKKGMAVYCLNDKEQLAVKKFLRPNFDQLFTIYGRKNTDLFSSLQSDYSSEVYTKIMGTNIQQISRALPEGKTLADVDFAVVSTWLTYANAVGNAKPIPHTIEGKTIDEINSLSYIDGFAEKFPGIFKNGSGKASLRFAHQHFNCGHSISSMREISLMLDQPNIFENYVSQLGHKQKQTLSFMQAMEILPISKVDNVEMKNPQLFPILKSRSR